MHEPGLDIPEEFYAYKDRASAYIARASHFPFQWGLPNGARNKNGFPIEFFRWDRRVLKRMIDRAEHIIRCLIIWMAWARLRSWLVVAAPSPLPPRTNHAPRTSEPPVHHLYSIRGLPLYDLRVAPFTVSLPTREFVGSPERNPSRNGRSKRIRNDKIFSSEILIMRMERLGKLYDEIDTRAARISGIWLGRMNYKEKAFLPPRGEKDWDEGGARSANQPPDEENSLPLTPAPLPLRGDKGKLRLDDTFDLFVFYASCSSSAVGKGFVRLSIWRRLDWSSPSSSAKAANPISSARVRKVATTSSVWRCVSNSC